MAKFRVPAVFATMESLAILQQSRARSLPQDLARLLPNDSPERAVTRVLNCLIVLTLALGQNAVPLCRAWCDTAQPTTTAGCGHEHANSAGVVASDSCETHVRDGAAIVRTSTRRAGADENLRPAIMFQPCALAVVHSDPHRGQRAIRVSSPSPPPLLIALRI